MGVLYGELRSEGGGPVALESFGRRNMLRNVLKGLMRVFPGSASGVIVFAEGDELVSGPAIRADPSSNDPIAVNSKQVNRVITSQEAMLFVDSDPKASSRQRSVICAPIAAPGAGPPPDSTSTEETLVEGLPPAGGGH